nr:hypothetical protein [candidate division Zixibacteria bacterium]
MTRKINRGIFIKQEGILVNKKAYYIILAILSMTAALAVLNCTSDKEKAVNPLIKYLPGDDAVPGWSRVDTAEVYVGEDLYLYIDGGADLYLKYGFKQVVTCEYRDFLDTRIIVEIFEMTDFSAAAGIYGEKTDDTGTIPGLGDKSSLEGYYLNFTRGRFLVTMTGYEQCSRFPDGLIYIAVAIDETIGKQE